MYPRRREAALNAHDPPQQRRRQAVGVLAHIACLEDHGKQHIVQQQGKRRDQT
jgi:hypothetical protein